MDILIAPVLPVSHLLYMSWPTVLTVSIATYPIFGVHTRNSVFSHIAYRVWFLCQLPHTELIAIMVNILMVNDFTNILLHTTKSIIYKS